MAGENKSRIPPQALRDLCDDLSVEVDLEMRRRNMRLRDLRHLGYSDTTIKEVSAWLRGASTQRHPGHVAALSLAERLNIPVRILVGAEAREVA